MKVRRALGTLLAASALCLPSVLHSNAQAVPQALSATGQRAFQDLARCLNTTPTLDVLYLVDESSSMQDTDPNNRRAAILASSLRQLGNMPAAKQVNYAIGFFGKSYSIWRNWSVLDSKNIDAAARNFASEAAARNEGTATDWLEGLTNAASALEAQAKKSQGCQVLVWLTDGGINVDNREDLTMAGLGRICGVNLDTGRPEQGSVINRLRQNNVVVFGVLLKSDDYLAEIRDSDPERYDFEIFGMSWMRPIVEGSGATDSVANRAGNCGTTPIPDDAAAGALLVATDPLSLAFQFKVLNSLATGATSSDLVGNPARFSVDRGIDRFRIVTTSVDGGWKLNGPTGEQITAASGGAGISVDKTGGATQITISVTKSRLGNWYFEYPDAATSQLFYFSGLSLQLDAGELVAGSQGAIAGRIVRELSGQAVDMSAYQDARVSIQTVSGGLSTSPQVAVLNRDGTFVLDNFVPAVDEGVLNVRATATLKTSTGLPLTPISVSQNLQVSLPRNFPSIAPRSLVLTDLEGVNGVATGAITVRGPEEGDGKVCRASEPRVVSDVVSRPNWQWTISGLDASGCIAVSQAEEKQLTVQARNPQAADGRVIASMPLEFSSSLDDRVLKLATQIQFNSTRPLPWWVPLVEVALLLLGFLIPLALLYLLNKLSTKIARGSNIQRFETQVLIDSKLGIRRGDGSALSAEATDFVFSPQLPDTRMHQDALGHMRAKVSHWPLSQSWFEMEAMPGDRLITSIAYPSRLAKRFASGRIAPVAGDLAKVWVLRVSEADLQNGGSVSATLVAYKRNNLANPDQHRELLASIAATSDIWSRVERIRQSMSQESQTNKKSKSQVPTVHAQSPSAIPPAPGEVNPADSGSSSKEGPSVPGSGPVPPPPPPPPVR